MPKLSSVYICQQCGYRSSQFLGKCPECGTWNSLVEQVESTSSRSIRDSAGLRGSRKILSTRAEIIDLSKIQKANYQRLSTKFEEFDRVLGGGIVTGSLILVSGDPGIGKSTLLTQLALNVNSSVIARREATKPASPVFDVASPTERGEQSGSVKSQIKIATPRSVNMNVARNDNGGVLYVAGEESAQQIKIRVDRVKPSAGLSVLNETDVDNIVEAVSSTKPGLVIVDSIQTLETADLESIAGSVGQVRECAHRLQKLAKSLHIPIFLVGHVTKEGNLAGPKTLEHVVDVVLSLEGDPTSQFRILRSTKNRFGPTDEVGIFEMAESGMIEVSNPSQLFLEQKVEAPGSAVVATMNGMRPIMVEIQALVTKSFLPMPRRTGSGIDNNRLQLLTAVLIKRLGLPLFDKDIFVNVTGGLKVLEPAVDLGICMAIVSSLKDQTLKPRTAFLGEVGLLGELRPVGQIDKRIKEAKKLGYSTVISFQNARNLTQAVKLSLI